MAGVASATGAGVTADPAGIIAVPAAGANRLALTLPA
jgi:hypothetical protein